MQGRSDAIDEKGKKFVIQTGSYDRSWLGQQNGFFVRLLLMSDPFSSVINTLHRGSN